MHYAAEKHNTADRHESVAVHCMNFLQKFDISEHTVVGVLTL